MEATAMHESPPGNENADDVPTDLTDKTFKSQLFYMENWRKSEDFDTFIVCSDGECAAHRPVLCHVSPFMGSLLDDQFPGQVTYYSVPDVSKRVMELLLDLAYTGTVICDTETLKDVEEAMKFLGWIRLDRMEKKVADEESIRLEAERRIKELHGSTQTRNSRRTSVQSQSKGRMRRSNAKMLVDDLSNGELNFINSSEFNDVKKSVNVETSIDATITRVIQGNLDVLSVKCDSPKKKQSETEKKQPSADEGMDESCGRKLGPNDVTKVVELMKERSSSMPKDNEVRPSSVPKGNEERSSSIPENNGERNNNEDNKESKPYSRRLRRNSARCTVATIVTGMHDEAAADPNPNTDARILETGSEFDKSQEESLREDNLGTSDKTMLPEHHNNESGKEIDLPQQQKSGTRRKRRRKVEILAELEGTMAPRKSLRKRSNLNGDSTSESPKKPRLNPTSIVPGSSRDNVKVTPEDINENHSELINEDTTFTSNGDKAANRDTGPTTKDETPRRSSRKARSVQGEISPEANQLPSPKDAENTTTSLPNNDRKSPHELHGIQVKSLDT